MNSHRDKFLDSLEGKRVKVWFKDGEILTGTLIYIDVDGCYALKNCMDTKRGFVTSSIEFRKTYIKKLEVSHG